MKIFYYFFTFFICIGCAVLGGSFYLLTNHWVDVSVLEHYEPGRASVVLDCKGKEWARFQLDRRDPVSISKMPSHLINAFLAAEDWHFFSHSGLSFKGIIRSILVNMYHGRRVQGASTITQQLVKLLFFDSAKTFSRKLKEQLYSLLIEQQFSKHQILQIYLNHVYFGCGIYGVEAACRRFWKISVEDISVEQAASLAAVIRNPSQYCPLLCPLSNEQRRNLILNNMYKLSFITKDQLDCSLDQPLFVVQEDGPCCAPHLKEDLRIFLERLVGKKELYSGGLTIQTTLDKSMQKNARSAFKTNCLHVQKELDRDVDGGLISIDVATGQMRAVVGGIDYAMSQYNRAFQAKRQMGSVFKPVVYAAAVEQGMKFNDVEVDEPLELVYGGATWAPKNYNKKFNGPITRAFALSHSNNIVTIKTLLQAGVEAVIDVAKRCRLNGPFNPYPSLALGCIDATLKECVGMFNVFANNGVYVRPYYISFVKDKWGKKIYKHTPEQERILSTNTTSQVAKVLELSVQRAYQWFSNQWIDCDALAKTGTTNDSRTCWYAGSTPTLTTAIYIGCDDNKSLGDSIYPIRTAFPIWLSFNRTIKNEIKQFVYDPELEEVVINERTGRWTHEYDEDAVEILI